MTPTELSRNRLSARLPSVEVMRATLVGLQAERASNVRLVENLRKYRGPAEREALALADRIAAHVQRSRALLNHALDGLSDAQNKTLTPAARRARMAEALPDMEGIYGEAQTIQRDVSKWRARAFR